MSVEICGFTVCPAERDHLTPMKLEFGITDFSSFFSASLNKQLPRKNIFIGEFETLLPLRNVIIPEFVNQSLINIQFSKIGVVA